jgi:hypothetical protein
MDSWRFDFRNGYGQLSKDDSCGLQIPLQWTAVYCWTPSLVYQLKNSRRFDTCLCYPPQVKIFLPNHLGPLEKANLNLRFFQLTQLIRLFILYLRTDAEPAAEDDVCFSTNRRGKLPNSMHQFNDTSSSIKFRLIQLQWLKYIFLGLEHNSL